MAVRWPLLGEVASLGLAGPPWALRFAGTSFAAATSWSPRGNLLPSSAKSPSAVARDPFLVERLLKSIDQNEKTQTKQLRAFDKATTRRRRGRRRGRRSTLESPPEASPNDDLAEQEDHWPRVDPTRGSSGLSVPSLRWLQSPEPSQEISDYDRDELETQSPPSPPPPPVTRRYNQPRNKKPVYVSINQQTVNGLLSLLLLFVVSICGSVGTILIISALTVIESLQTRGNCYLVSLALAHLIVTLLVIPTSALQIMAGDGIDSRLVCHYQWLILEFSLIVSQLSFLLIAADNYLGYKSSEKLTTSASQLALAAPPSPAPPGLPAPVMRGCHHRHHHPAGVASSGGAAQPQLSHPATSSTNERQLPVGQATQPLRQTGDRVMSKQSAPDEHVAGAGAAAEAAATMTTATDGPRRRAFRSISGLRAAPVISSLFEALAGHQNPSPPIAALVKPPARAKLRPRLASQFADRKDTKLHPRGCFSYRNCCSRLRVLLWITLVWALALAYTIHQHELRYGAKFCAAGPSGGGGSAQSSQAAKRPDPVQLQPVPAAASGNASQAAHLWAQGESRGGRSNYRAPSAAASQASDEQLSENARVSSSSSSHRRRHQHSAQVAEARGQPTGGPMTHEKRRRRRQLHDSYLGEFDESNGNPPLDWRATKGSNGEPLAARQGPSSLRAAAAQSGARPALDEVVRESSKHLPAAAWPKLSSPAPPERIRLRKQTKADASGEPASGAADKTHQQRRRRRRRRADKSAADLAQREPHYLGTSEGPKPIAGMTAHNGLARGSDEVNGELAAGWAFGQTPWAWDWGNFLNFWRLTEQDRLRGDAQSGRSAALGGQVEEGGANNEEPHNNNNEKSRVRVPSASTSSKGTYSETRYDSCHRNRSAGESISDEEAESCTGNNNDEAADNSVSEQNSDQPATGNRLDAVSQPKQGQVASYLDLLNGSIAWSSGQTAGLEAPWSPSRLDGDRVRHWEHSTSDKIGARRDRSDRDETDRKRRPRTDGGRQVVAEVEPLEKHHPAAAAGPSLKLEPQHARQQPEEGRKTLLDHNVALDAAGRPSFGPHYWRREEQVGDASARDLMNNNHKSNNNEARMQIMMTSHDGRPAVEGSSAAVAKLMQKQSSSSSLGPTPLVKRTAHHQLLARKSAARKAEALNFVPHEPSEAQNEEAEILASGAWTNNNKHHVRPKRLAGHDDEKSNHPPTGNLTAPAGSGVGSTSNASRQPEYYWWMLFGAVLVPSLASMVLFLGAYLRMKEFKMRPYKPMPMMALNSSAVSSLLMPAVLKSPPLPSQQQQQQLHQDTNFQHQSNQQQAPSVAGQSAAHKQVQAANEPGDAKLAFDEWSPASGDSHVTSSMAVASNRMAEHNRRPMSQPSGICPTGSAPSSNQVPTHTDTMEPSVALATLPVADTANPPGARHRPRGSMDVVSPTPGGGHHRQMGPRAASFSPAAPPSTPLPLSPAPGGGGGAGNGRHQQVNQVMSAPIGGYSHFMQQQHQFELAHQHPYGLHLLSPAAAQQAAAADAPITVAGNFAPGRLAQTFSTAVAAPSLPASPALMQRDTSFSAPSSATFGPREHLADGLFGGAEPPAYHQAVGYQQHQQLNHLPSQLIRRPSPIELQQQQQHYEFRRRQHHAQSFHYGSSNMRHFVPEGREPPRVSGSQQQPREGAQAHRALQPLAAGSAAGVASSPPFDAVCFDELSSESQQQPRPLPPARPLSREAEGEPGGGHLLGRHRSLPRSSRLHHGELVRQHSVNGAAAAAAMGPDSGQNGQAARQMRRHRKQRASIEGRIDEIGASGHSDDCGPMSTALANIIRSMDEMQPRSEADELAAGDSGGWQDENIHRPQARDAPATEPHYPISMSGQPQASGGSPKVNKPQVGPTGPVAKRRSQVSATEGNWSPSPGIAATAPSAVDQQQQQQQQLKAATHDNNNAAANYQPKSSAPANGPQQPPAAAAATTTRQPLASTTNKAILCTYFYMTDDQLLKSNIIVFIINLTLWLPFILLSIAAQYRDHLSQELKDSVWWLATLNCCSCSYVYAITNKDFREAFNKLFYYCCCKSHVTFARKTPIFRRQLDLDSEGNLRIHIIPGLNVYSNKLSVGGDVSGGGGGSNGLHAPGLGGGSLAPGGALASHHLSSGGGGAHSFRSTSGHEGLHHSGGGAAGPASQAHRHHMSVGGGFGGPLFATSKPYGGGGGGSSHSSAVEGKFHARGYLSSGHDRPPASEL